VYLTQEKMTLRRYCRFSHFCSDYRLVCHQFMGNIVNMPVAVGTLRHHNAAVEVFRYQIIAE